MLYLVGQMGGFSKLVLEFQNFVMNSEGFGETWQKCAVQITTGVDGGPSGGLSVCTPIGASRMGNNIATTGFIVGLSDI